MFYKCSQLSWFRKPIDDPAWTIVSLQRRKNHLCSLHPIIFKNIDTFQKYKRLDAIRTSTHQLFLR